MIKQPTPYHELINDNWVLNKNLLINSFVRPKRNNLLDRIDLIYCNSERWETLSEDQKNLVKSRKQDLRDFPETILDEINNIEEIIFPTVVIF